VTATADYKTLVERASKELAQASAAESLRWTVDTFGNDFIVASNMQDAVLIDLATKAKSDVDVLFLETGYHFPETIGTRDAIQTVYPELHIVNAQAEQSVAEQDAEYGEKLHDRDPALCCNLRKVVPLKKTLANYSAWVTGVRRVDAPTRANTPIVTWDDRNGLVKINPIAAWTDDEFNGYIREHSILENPLVSIGFLSIGCAPCTAKVEAGQDARSGRWAGQSKTECGLHG